MKGIRHGSGSKLLGADDRPDSADEGEQRCGPEGKPKKPKKPVAVAKIKGFAK